MSEISAELASRLRDIHLTPGELALFAKIAREQEVLNALMRKFGAVRDRIVENNNTFVDELCRKYGIAQGDRRKVTFDKVTGRLVSIFSTTFSGHRIEVSTAALDGEAARLAQGAIRELIAVHKATHEEKSDGGRKEARG